MKTGLGRPPASLESIPGRYPRSRNGDIGEIRRALHTEPKQANCNFELTIDSPSATCGRCFSMLIGSLSSTDQMFASMSKIVLPSGLPGLSNLDASASHAVSTGETGEVKRNWKISFFPIKARLSRSLIRTFFKTFQRVLRG